MSAVVPEATGSLNCSEAAAPASLHAETPAPALAAAPAPVATEAAAPLPAPPAVAAAPLLPQVTSSSSSTLLDALFPPLTAAPPAPDVAARFAAYHAATLAGHDFTATLRAKRDFQNPYILARVIEAMDVQEYASRLPPSVFGVQELAGLGDYESLAAAQAAVAAGAGGGVVAANGGSSAGGAVSGRAVPPSAAAPR